MLVEWDPQEKNYLTTTAVVFLPEAYAFEDDRLESTAGRHVVARGRIKNALLVFPRLKD